MKEEQIMSNWNNCTNPSGVLATALIATILGVIYVFMHFGAHNFSFRTINLTSFSNYENKTFFQHIYTYTYAYFISLKASLKFAYL